MRPRTKEEEAVYREKNRSRIYAYHREWYHKTKESKREAQRLYRIKNIDKIRIAQKENNRKRRIEILAMLGDRCVKCGFNSDYRALQIDHVRSNGSEERKLMVHSWSYKFWLKALTERRDDYQLLCANCNWIKRSEKNELWRKIPLILSLA